MKTPRITYEKALELLKEKMEQGLSARKAIWDIATDNEIIAVTGRNKNKKMAITPKTFEDRVYTSGIHIQFQNEILNKQAKEKPAENDLHMSVKNYLKKKKDATIVDISDAVDASPKKVLAAIETLKESGYNVAVKDHMIMFGGNIQKNDPMILDIHAMSKGHYKFGLIGDNHMGSNYSRLDVLDAAYKMFEQEGVKEVYNTGNWIDGEARFNKQDLHVHGMGKQIQHFVDRYPSVEGITTYYVSGDDHEGWYNQREGVNIGEYAQMIAEKNGRNDLIHLGYMEHDVILKAPNGETRMRIQHPGGGSAYAFSYQPQKIVESLTGGEKPHILALGHYHKHSYDYIRGVHTVQTGCTQDQTPFMRKKRLAAHLGFVIIEFWTDDNGAITRFKHEFFPFYDVDYYRNWEYKW